MKMIYAVIWGINSVGFTDREKAKTFADALKIDLQARKIELKVNIKSIPLYETLLEALQQHGLINTERIDDVIQYISVINMHRNTEEPGNVKYLENFKVKYKENSSMLKIAEYPCDAKPELRMYVDKNENNKPMLFILFNVACKKDGDGIDQDYFKYFRDRRNELLSMAKHLICFWGEPSRYLNENTIWENYGFTKMHEDEYCEIYRQTFKMADAV